MRPVAKLKPVFFAVSVALAVLGASPARADVVDDYVSTVRAALERGKHFPTGRDISIEQPTGATEVTFVLDRRGKVKSAKVTKPSFSSPLDQMATSLVKRAKYKPFPAEAWAGAPTETFVVTYNFTRSKTGSVSVGEPTEVNVR